MLCLFSQTKLVVFPSIVLTLHCHVEVIHGIFVHTFNGDHANLDSCGLQEVVLKLVLFVHTFSVGRANLSIGDFQEVLLKLKSS